MKNIENYSMYKENVFIFTALITKSYFTCFVFRENIFYVSDCRTHKDLPDLVVDTNVDESTGTGNAIVRSEEV